MAPTRRRGEETKCPERPIPTESGRLQGPEGLLADGEEAAVPTPVVAVPAEAEAALGVAPEEVGHAAAAVRDDPGRAEGDHRELPLDVGVVRPERQELRERRRAQAARLEVGLDLGRARHLVQVSRVPAWFRRYPRP